MLPSCYSTTIKPPPPSGDLAVGYSKGAMRIVRDGEVVEEYLTLTAQITSTTFLSNGDYLFVSDALGILFAKM